MNWCSFSRTHLKNFKLDAMAIYWCHGDHNLFNCLLTEQEPKLLSKIAKLFRYKLSEIVSKKIL